jgi:4,5-DOPA dioxygenase extradiol
VGPGPRGLVGAPAPLPAAEIPVFQLSLDYSFNDWHPKPVQHHYDLARELAPLREQGVLVVGSGNIVHNLWPASTGTWTPAPNPWTVEFDERVRQCLVSGNHRDLVAFESLGPSASLAVPTLDHYLPMVYALALQEAGEPVTFVHEGMENASISMRCLQVG